MATIICSHYWTIIGKIVKEGITYLSKYMIFINACFELQFGLYAKQPILFINIYPYNISNYCSIFKHNSNLWTGTQSLPYCDHLYLQYNA